MERRPACDKVKELFWRKALVRFAESGLSQSAFCKREGLNQNNFSWWKRTILERDAEKGTPSTKGEQQTPFVPVIPRAEDLSPTQRDPAPVAEIDLDTRTVRIFKAAGAETLRALLTVFRDWAK